MNNSVEEARESYFRWLKAFNSRDINGMLDEMHFPHIRISGRNKIQIWSSRDDQISRHDGMSERLYAEDWVETITSDLRAVREGPDKVHLAMKQYRRNRDGMDYNIFDTLWIFTRENGKWGVRFRPSYQFGSSKVGSVANG
tara:strand:+ start:388 stop:810 length:423 start_codon:yes stop_codon:yes gene_type:complete